MVVPRRAMGRKAAFPRAIGQSIKVIMIMRIRAPGEIVSSFCPGKLAARIQRYEAETSLYSLYALGEQKCAIRGRPRILAPRTSCCSPFAVDHAGSTLRRMTRKACRTAGCCIKRSPSRPHPKEPSS